jgi:hypothetical protein
VAFISGGSADALPPFSSPDFLHFMAHRSPQMVSLVAALAAAALLASCRTPVPMWNEDGRTMTDLRALRIRGRQSVELTPGVRLYADEIRYGDKRKRTGEARGRVFLDIQPALRYDWMVRYGYAGAATFDRKQEWVSLGGLPILEREFMTQIATEPYTTIDLRWDTPMAEVIVRGPTRTDFAKSHPVPPGAVLPTAVIPAEPPRKSLREMGFSKG